MQLTVWNVSVFEVILVRIFPEKLQIQTHFTQWHVYKKIPIYKGGEHFDNLFCSNYIKYWSRWVKEKFEQRIK